MKRSSISYPLLELHSILEREETEKATGFPFLFNCYKDKRKSHKKKLNEINK